MSTTKSFLLRSKITAEEDAYLRDLSLSSSEVAQITGLSLIYVSSRRRYLKWKDKRTRTSSTAEVNDDSRDHSNTTLVCSKITAEEDAYLRDRSLSSSEVAQITDLPVKYVSSRRSYLNRKDRKSSTRHIVRENDGEVRIDDFRANPMVTTQLSRKRSFQDMDCRFESVESSPTHSVSSGHLLGSKVASLPVDMNLDLPPRAELLPGTFSQTSTFTELCQECGPCVASEGDGSNPVLDSVVELAVSVRTSLALALRNAEIEETEAEAKYAQAVRELVDCGDLIEAGRLKQEHEVCVSEWKNKIRALQRQIYREYCDALCGAGGEVVK